MRMRFALEYALNVKIVIVPNAWDIVEILSASLW